MNLDENKSIESKDGIGYIEEKIPLEKLLSDHHEVWYDFIGMEDEEEMYRRFPNSKYLYGVNFPELKYKIFEEVEYWNYLSINFKEKEGIFRYNINAFYKYLKDIKSEIDLDQLHNSFSRDVIEYNQYRYYFEEELFGNILKEN